MNERYEERSICKNCIRNLLYNFRDIDQFFVKFDNLHKLIFSALSYYSNVNTKNIKGIYVYD